MASNEIPESYEGLFSLAEDAADGAHDHEATISARNGRVRGRRLDLRTAAWPFARSAVGAKKTAKGNAFDALEEAIGAMRTRLSGLRYELGQRLDDDDPRWYAFGFNRPGDPETPQVPEGLTVVAGGQPGRAFADWDDSRRRVGFHLYIQLEGEPEPVRRGTTSETEAMLSDLPSGQTVYVSVRAYNDAGESAASDAVSIVVP